VRPLLDVTHLTPHGKLRSRDAIGVNQILKRLKDWKAIQQPPGPTSSSFEECREENGHLCTQSGFDEDTRRELLVGYQPEHLIGNKQTQDILEVLDK